MQSTVTNSHHFCEEVKLQISNTSMYWNVANSILDPKNVIEDFVLSLYTAFIFIGTLTDMYYTNDIKDLLIESDQNLTMGDIIKFIYDYPLEQNIKFVSMDYCGCNMGNCSQLVGINIDDIEYKTYGDVMALFGMCFKHPNGNIYYEYPDSVLLRLEQITKLPNIIYERNNSHDKEIRVTEQLDPNIIYLSYGYSR